ncbi:MAG: methionyl-tRNA formyltransferase [Alphaproteobacteria bacterium]|uniref:Methionyl-tRNA formyltransferase n=1 Tax=Candidatus Nitrobium versatile TaxID=2884831 RepID=A0A953M1V8_9BACT|nr:methionyl-tRNA formyltransferase [Candidatus Nitrobium versatile]
MKKIRTVYISNGENGWHVLQEILRNHPAFEVQAVFTTPPPESEESISGYRSFRDLAEAFSLPLFEVKNSASLRNIISLSPDIIFCIGWSRLLPKDILAVPPLGAIGMHPTLLPEGRGRAPIPWAIIKGMSRSGVTMFYLDEGVDSGDIIVQKEFEIRFEDDAASVYFKAVSAMVGLAREYLPLLAEGQAHRKEQEEAKASWWERRTPEDGCIDWSKSVLENYNFIRALTRPYPGAFTYHRKTKVRLWKSAPRDSGGRSKPGVILDVNRHHRSFTVSCRKGSLEILSFEGIDFTSLRTGDTLGKVMR